MVCSVYGLTLWTNQPVPGLRALPAGPEVEVEVWLGFMPAWGHEDAARLWYARETLDEHGKPTLIVWQTGNGSHFRLRYSDGTEFLVNRSGTKIWAVWPATLSLEDTATYLLGPVMGFVLLLRGAFSLHASAVVVEGQAVALLGAAGAGKSTAAAAFARLGYPVLTEDVTALADRGDRFLAQPGYPLIRLWPEAVNILYGANDALPLLTPNWDKCYLPLDGDGLRLHSEPLPLAAIYLLDERRDEPAAPFIADLPAQETLMSLVAHTYATYLMDKEMRAREFEMLRRLIARVPMRRVHPHTDPARLPQLCQTILDDFAEHGRL